MPLSLIRRDEQDDVEDCDDLSWTGRSGGAQDVLAAAAPDHETDAAQVSEEPTAAAQEPKKRKNLPTPDGVFTANGRCNLCECKYGGGDKARITHENGKRHQANLAAKRRRTE